MHPVDFSYTAPTNVAEACAELSDQPGRTCALAGGMSLMPQLVRRAARPRRLVDITRIGSLRRLTPTADSLRVGAAVTQRTLERCTELTDFDLLRQALSRVGTVPTRNRGTVGGSLAYADPAAQIGVCLLALGGEVSATSTDGARRIPAPEFFQQTHRSALRHDELLTEVRFARPAEGTVGYFESVSLRGVGDTPLISVALLAHRRAATPPRLVIGGAGQIPTAVPLAPWDAPGDLSEEEIADASSAVRRALRFEDDVRASGAHRMRLAVRVVGGLLRRVREEFR